MERKQERNEEIMDLDERILKYPQPYSIVIPDYMNEAQAERYKQYEHNRLKHEARYRTKYLRSKWQKRLYNKEG